MELNNLFNAVRNSPPENMLETAYKMFTEMQSASCMADGFTLLAFFNSLELYETNLPSTDTLNKDAIKKLKDAVIAEIRIIADKTSYIGFKGVFRTTELQKAIIEYGLEEALFDIN